MSRFTLRTRYTIFSLCVLSALVIGGITSYLLAGANAQAKPVQSNFNHFLSTHYDDHQYNDNYSSGPGQEQYDNRAYPRTTVSYDQVMRAYNAFRSLSTRAFGQQGQSWQLVGPTTNSVPGPVTYTGRPTAISGRVTAIAVSNSCNQNLCRFWVGAAGGGIWTTTHGLSQTPDWHSSSNGIPSNAIGSITIDPTDPSGRTLYVGTGEPNGSSDSEAGVGLYKSTDYGQTWHLVPGSITAAKDRSIGAIAIDPANSKHIYIGTDVARHGSSSVNGGRFSPPHALVIGLYESTDGGNSFYLVFSKETDIVNPGTPSGSDFFRGGITKIAFDRTGLAAGQPSVAYFSVFDYGLYRSINGSFEQIFASAGGGSIAKSAGARTEFALAPMGSKLRIYVGDTDGNTADFYRVDDANVAASTLTDGTNNAGWIKLSNSTKGAPGYASYDFCNAQCDYDMWVASPAGQPDTVWIGGSMQYSEIFTAHQPSNGRAVQRSTNAGVDFTDMTNDMQSPPLGMHPDQHAVAFAPGNPNIAFLGSDGGLVRTSGSFGDGSSDCANRGLSGVDLADCQNWLKVIPTRIYSLNAGLATLQFQSLTVNPQNPRGDIMGGTQDNGTFAYSANLTSGFESVGGDGGQSVIDAGNPSIRMHTYYGPQGDVNFKGTNPLSWDWMADPLVASKEAASFYIPLIGDPKVSGTMFAGLEHVWRTQDSGGPQAYLDQHCNESTGDFKTPCGDWVPLGPNLVDTTFGTDKVGSYVVAISRAPSDKSTMWVATRLGRLFISTNANAMANSVTFTRIDTSAQPNRFISGIAVDPTNPYHAFVSFSGYDAYTPMTTGHVFDVRYNPATGKATWKNITYGLGDMPITGIAYDSHAGNLYVSTDFGVELLRAHSTTWAPAASGLPAVAVYGLTISNSAHVLYAATHGRGAWRLNL